MTEFTSGEWELAWEDGKHGVVAASVDGKMVFIGMIGNNDNDPIKNETRKANARLVSAAPNLFWALTDLFAMVQGEVPSLLEDHHMFDVVSAALTKARNE